MSEKLYYSIREVAAMFSLNESTLRFWETEFETIHPKKTTTGIRQYTQKDIEEVRMVNFLVREKGMTLAGARKKIKDDRRSVSAKVELLDRLNKIKDELLAIKSELD